MAHVERTPYAGELEISATDAKDILFDLPDHATKALKHEKDGVDEAEAELAVALPKYAGVLGIAPEMMQRIEDSTKKITLLRSKRGRVRKLEEVLRESELLHEDEREALLSIIAETVKKTSARLDPSVKAAFEKTLKYVSQTADKAAATRRKRKAAESGRVG
ncbi:hypothetical protein [Polyangium spumosum]|uniref:Uncharacterized protein n=1 Tax=Polyangium spumosum TaxID=889282 RepID=A0A6N7PJ25_9BACT|nr:hypothetical protein [Polyangium spumosum]MRG92112.1 hypothetical protein [Polyangium spumosum]